MLGISEVNVIEHIEGESDRPADTNDGVRLHHNETDPELISDGIDVVTVAERSRNRYAIDYWGYRIGYALVNRDGVEELGESLLADRARIPHWIVDAAPAERPWWFPEDYDGERTLACDACGAETAADRLVAPSRFHGVTDPTFCRDCWDEGISVTDLHPNGGREASIAKARELADTAATDAEAVDLDALRKLLDHDDAAVLAATLAAVEHPVGAHGGDVLDVLPRATTHLKHDAPAVRTAALAVAAALAEEYPSQVTPAADQVLGLLSPGAALDIREPAITYLHAVAEDDPNAVLDAVPTLAALLEEGTGREQDILDTIRRVADAYPESIVPVTRQLLAYVDEDADHPVTALAALGQVAKEYPNVAESAIPSLLDVLDSENFYYRANASGVLAELADEYPGQLTESVHAFVKLLGDDDEKARYNATSILARIAKEHPGAVEPATDPLIDALDEEMSWARENACWALGYLEAEAAREELAGVEAADPDEQVRTTAGWALAQLPDED